MHRGSESHFPVRLFSLLANSLLRLSCDATVRFGSENFPVTLESPLSPLIDQLGQFLEIGD